MTDPALLELATAVQFMRSQQRAFFAADPGSIARRDALTASKRAEKQVDELVARALGYAPPEPVQGALFGGRR